MAQSYPSIQCKDRWIRLRHVYVRQYKRYICSNFWTERAPMSLKHDEGYIIPFTIVRGICILFFLQYILSLLYLLCFYHPTVVQLQNKAYIIFFIMLSLVFFRFSLTLRFICSCLAIILVIVFLSTETQLISSLLGGY